LPRKPHKTITKTNTTTNAKLRDAKLTVDIKRVQQELMQPFQPFEFKLSTPEGLEKFTNDLIHSLMRHELDYRIAGAINGAVGNYLHNNIELKELNEVKDRLEELERERQLAVKNGLLTQPIQRTEYSTTTTNDS
jgi:hypothetical protein